MSDTAEVPKRLYEVRAAVSMVVWAANAEEAERIAENVRRGLSLRWRVEGATTLNDQQMALPLPEGWAGSGRPYGGPGIATLQELWDRQQAADAEAARIAGGAMNKVTVKRAERAAEAAEEAKS